MENAYHHGSLRNSLLADGRKLLVSRGVEAVSLRELARRSGVSHAAPSRHFTDRDALLAALAAEGFQDLTAVLEVASREQDLDSQLKSYAHGFVRFAVENGPLVALMFGTKSGSGSHPEGAADQYFRRGAELLGEKTSSPTLHAAYLVAATLEGISSLVINGRLPSSELEGVVDAAVSMLLKAIRG
ncbi:TetR/AcrR family transcriptional regulator [soil metagenome]